MTIAVSKQAVAYLFARKSMTMGIDLLIATSCNGCTYQVCCACLHLLT